ncbi:unnamed protein product [Schistocephalus solidus]|uniref:Uncharacterized protein n=1 Tax=Schistocephalus solidus TaxID=70667 RepID=A0A183T4U7_SCHSO|nr:unnamed protein product [Schistocephalus solidus]
MDGLSPHHLQVEALSATTQETPSNELANRLANLPVTDEDASVENRWCQLRDTDSFDNNDAAIYNLLAEKNRLYKACIDRPTAANKTAFYRSRRLVQQRLRELQDAWMACKTKEIQGYMDCNEWKNIFAVTKAVYGPPIKGAAPLLCADGTTLLTEQAQILKHWAEHFQSVFNQPCTMSDAAIDQLSDVETNHNLDLLPYLQETIRAVQKLSSGKAPGSDSIPADICKHVDAKPGDLAARTGPSGFQRRNDRR